MLRSLWIELDFERFMKKEVRIICKKDKCNMVTEICKGDRDIKFF